MTTAKLVFVTAMAAALVRAQQVTVLDIDLENMVQYVGDVTDPGRVATVATPTPPAATRAFTETILIGDIVAVNVSRPRGFGVRASTAWHTTRTRSRAPQSPM